MGVNYNSMLVLGTRIPLCDIFELKIQKLQACQCTESKPEIYCPICGKKGLKIIKVELINKILPGEDYSWEDNYDGSCDEGKEFRCFPDIGKWCINFHKERLYESRVYFGKSIGESFYGSGTDRIEDKKLNLDQLMPAAETYKKKLKSLLEPLGVWNENEYSLYSYLDVG